MTKKLKVDKEVIFNYLNNEVSEYVKCLDYLKSTYSNKQINQIYQNYLLKENDNFNCVYFIRNKYTNLVKIGSTTDIIRRFNELNSLYKNYLGVDDSLKIEFLLYIPYNIKPSVYEKQIHKELKKHRKFGEWFDIGYDDIFYKYCNDTYEFYSGICVAPVDVLDIEKDICDQYTFDTSKNTDEFSIRKMVVNNCFKNTDNDYLLINQIKKDFTGEYETIFTTCGFTYIDLLQWAFKNNYINDCDILIKNNIENYMVGIVEMLRKELNTAKQIQG